MARIYCNDVAPRDGFQNEKTFIPTEDKVRLIDALSMTGLAKIEATSYVSPKAIPALADAEAVMAQIQRVPGVIYTVLVPNVRGAERALDGKADEFNLVMSASETHNLANLRMTREQSLAALGEVLALARGAGVPVNASLSCCFGCPMEGDVAVDEVLRLSEALLAQGARGITLCDTTGMAYPTQVEQLTRRFIERFPQAEVTLHFHDTRGMALANVLAGVAAGARRFDASLGGLGGCPYAPGASGNVVTEDLVFMFEAMGVATGINLEKLIAARAPLQAGLPGESIYGMTPEAGLPRDFVPATRGAHG